jgi:hypothetical protein
MEKGEKTMENKIKNMLDYAHFNTEDYQPSFFRDTLVQCAKDIYEMYLNGNIKPPTVDSVEGAFHDLVSNYLQGAPYEDINYLTILDDLKLFVDENNIKLKSKSINTKAFGRHAENPKGVSLTYDSNEEEKEYTVFGTKI